MTSILEFLEKWRAVHKAEFTFLFQTKEKLADKKDKGAAVIFSSFYSSTS